MTDQIKSTISRGAAWYTISTIGLKFVGLATIFLILHRLNVYEYGLLELILSAVALFDIFQLPGLQDTIIADMGRERGMGKIGNARQIYWNYFKLQLTLSFIAWALVFFGSNIIASFYGKNIGDYLKIASCMFLVNPFRLLFTVLYGVNLKFFLQSLLSFFEEVLKLGFVALNFFVFNMNAEGVILASVLSSAAILLILTPSLVGVYRPYKGARPDAPASIWNILFAHGKWGILTRYTDSLGKNIRIWIIKLLLGTEAVGLFAVADGLLNHTISLIPLSRIVSPMLPQYSHDKNLFFKIVDKSIKYQLIAYVLLGVVAFFLFPPIIAWLFPNYASALPLFRVMLFIPLLTSFGSIFTIMFYTFKVQLNLFLATCVKVISITILTYICIKLFGFYGIAYSYILVTLVFMLDRYRSLKKTIPGFKMRFHDFISIDSTDTMVYRFLIQKFKSLLPR